MKKTVLQKLIDEYEVKLANVQLLRSQSPGLNSAREVRLQVKEEMYGDFLSVLRRDIPKEREQIMQAHYAPRYGMFSENYYNQTFEQ